MGGMGTKSEKIAARNPRKVKKIWLGAPPPDPRTLLGGSAPKTPRTRYPIEQINFSKISMNKFAPARCFIDFLETIDFFNTVGGQAAKN